MDYLNRESLLKALTDLREDDFKHPTLTGALRIREVTAQQAFDMRQATGSGTDAFDTVLWYGLTITNGVIDKPGGVPMLTLDDALDLGKGRDGLIRDLANAIWTLAEGRPGDIKPPSNG